VFTTYVGDRPASAIQSATVPFLDPASKQALQDEQLTWKQGEVLWGAFAVVSTSVGAPILIPVLATLIAVHAKLKDLALEKALSDPPRDDYLSQTIPRRRRFHAEALGESPLERRTSAFCVAVLDANAYLEAMVRADERSLGALEAGATELQRSHAQTSARYAQEAARLQGRVADSARSLSQTFDQAVPEAGDPGQLGDDDVRAVTERPLEDLLPPPAIESLIRAGVRKDDLTHPLGRARRAHRFGDAAVSEPLPALVTVSMSPVAALQASGGSAAVSGEVALRRLSRLDVRLGPSWPASDPPKRPSEWISELGSARLDVYQVKPSTFRWRLRDPNGRPIAVSERAYSGPSLAVRAARAFRERLSEYGPEVYRERSGQFRWRLISRTREPIAVSVEAWANRAAAERDAFSAMSMARAARFAP
jgi:uncharacterized protein YegP (UPF0339 family)